MFIGITLITALDPDPGLSTEDGAAHNCSTVGVDQMQRAIFPMGINKLEVTSLL